MNKLLNFTLATVFFVLSTNSLKSNDFPTLARSEFVFACMSLYLDVIMLFVRLLELFGDRR